MAKSKRIRSIIGEFGIIITLLREIVLFSGLSPFFFTTDNILNVTLQTSITAIIAAGMTFYQHLFWLRFYIITLLNKGEISLHAI